MCAAVVPDVNPLKDILTSIILLVVSSITVACPVPGEATGGNSFAPMRLADKVTMSAFAAGDDKIRVALVKQITERRP
jgi:hypothetical protein